MLLTQPSDQRSLPEFKTDDLQTTDLQTANLHIEVQNLQRTESLNFSTQSLEFTVNRRIISQAFVQKSLSILQRKLPFENVRSQISNLRMNLLDIAGGSDNS
ncbi:MAG: hypothetical protein ACK53Y_00305, partial [bacterium]